MRRSKQLRADRHPPIIVVIGVDRTQFCKSGKRPGDIPSNPHITYKDVGWQGMGFWLGYGLASKEPGGSPALAVQSGARKQPRAALQTSANTAATGAEGPAGRSTRRSTHTGNGDGNNNGSGGNGSASPLPPLERCFEPSSPPPPPEEPDSSDEGSDAGAGGANGTAEGSGEPGTTAEDNRKATGRSSGSEGTNRGDGGGRARADARASSSGPKGPKGQKGSKGSSSTPAGFYSRGGKLISKSMVPYSEGVAFARSLGMTSSREWYAWCRSGARPSNIPAAPDRSCVTQATAVTEPNGRIAWCSCG